MQRSSLTIASLLGLSLSVGCGDGKNAGYGDYEEEKVTVIGSTTDADTSGEERITVSSPDGTEEECVQVSDTLCVPPDTEGSEWCEREGGPVDVVIVEGEIVEVICYPPSNDEERSTEEVDATTEGDIDIVQNANNTTVVFNDELDGEPFEGDMSIDGNNVAVYGNGTENTIIDGDVVITGNNVRLRGMTITGNLTVGLNSAAVVLCRVLGDVVLSMNNTVFVENDVFGSLTNTMNNTTIVGNDVQGEWAISGQGLVCDANHAFTDSNEDEWVQDEERGDLLACQ